MIVVSPHCGLRPASILGGEIYERQLLSRLPRHDVDLEIGLPAGRPVEPVDGWRVTLLRPGRWLRWYVAPLAFVPYVVHLLRRGDVELLRGHSVRFTGPSLLLARRLARRRDVPVVLHHLHTDPAWSAIDSWILRRADAIVTISEYSRRQLLEARIPAGRVHVIYPGVEVPKVLPEPWPDAWPAGRLRVLFVGRLIGRKRPDLAIRAIADAQARGVGATLVVAGSGPLEPRLRQLVSHLGSGDRVTFLGHVSDQQKWRLLLAADVFVFPSALEGFGFAAAEAHAVGVPAVCTAGTAAAEIVRDGESGFTVADDPVAYAAALAALVDERRRQDFAAGARAAAASFSWDRSAAAVADVYRSVARERGNLTA